VYAFVTTWNEFIFALVFAQDSRVKTLPIGIAEFSTEFDTDWGAVMAASMVMTPPVAIVFLLIPPDAAAVRRRPDGRRHQRLIIVAPVSNGSVGRRLGRSRLNRRAGAALPWVRPPPRAAGDLRPSWSRRCLWIRWPFRSARHAPPLNSRRRARRKKTSQIRRWPRRCRAKHGGNAPPRSCVLRRT
jgi:hypothetical protein